MINKDQLRQYERNKCIVFRKTNEAFGGLSNMAPGYPIKINDIIIGTTEALYQSCRFPDSIDVQKMIIEEKSPMTAKMKSKPFRLQTRQDWEKVRVKIMRWCLQVKLACNLHKFGQLLLETDDKPIVEDSHKDKFWGTVENKEEMLEGMNILGRLLMELRELLKKNGKESFKTVDPPQIDNFLLLGKPLPIINLKQAHKDEEEQKKVPQKPSQLYFDSPLNNRSTDV
jgi:ribA/ribD-fused uncharacterized protein|tara:strand:+ start:698 stop:1378 length:681 start_codon:yes stop_codon:yes gene_type:complete